MHTLLLINSQDSGAQLWLFQRWPTSIREFQWGTPSSSIRGGQASSKTSSTWIPTSNWMKTVKRSLLMKKTTSMKDPSTAWSWRESISGIFLSPSFTERIRPRIGDQSLLWKTLKIKKAVGVNTERWANPIKERKAMGILWKLTFRYRVLFIERPQEGSQEGGITLRLKLETKRSSWMLILSCFTLLTMEKVKVLSVKTWLIPSTTTALKGTKKKKKEIRLFNQKQYQK